MSGLFGNKIQVFGVLFCFAFFLAVLPGLQDLSSPDPLGSEVQSPDQWTAREFPGLSFYWER